MRVLVVGASGVIGVRLVRRLTAAGHQVIGTYRRPGQHTAITALGAEAVQLDLLDRPAVLAAVRAAAPDAILHEGTALGSAAFGRNFDKVFAETNRLRTDGTDALLAAAEDVGVSRFIAQSFASSRYERRGSWVKDEDAPLDDDPPAKSRQAHAAMRHLDATVVAHGGIVLRYGGFYGAANDGLLDAVRKRQFPIVGEGAGHISFIHLDDAAAGTVAALERGTASNVYHIVDDEPAPLRDWLPVMAQALGAPPPRHVPVWLARLLAGDVAVTMTTEGRAASNAKAKAELGWRPQYPSWRDGFFAAYGELPRGRVAAG